MARIVFVTMVAGLVLMADTARGRCQVNEPGPGEGGAVLKDPLAPAVAPKAVPAPGNYVESLIKQAPMVNPNQTPGIRQSQALEEEPDINQDIQVKKELGPWMIMVHAYSGPDAPVMARQMVMELRATYKLPAYTFSYGAEEKRKEYERKKAIIEKQREYLIKKGLPLDEKIRVRTMRTSEQVGVLIGGYGSEEAAKHMVDQIRKLKPLDPNKVMLDKRVIYVEEKKKDNSALSASKAMEGYVNPFLGAFVAHNPTVKQVRPADWDKVDMTLLQKLNSRESFSLLNCKKPFTLVVKDFKTPTLFQQKAEKGSFLETIGLGVKSGQREDAAATSAHNLAELLHKANLDVYVLHTKYTSIVCVGGYDSLDDPNMRSMANLIETKVMPQIAQLFPQLPGQGIAQAKVVPWPVPH
jgi:hypothetical protein